MLAEADNPADTPATEPADPTLDKAPAAVRLVEVALQVPTLPRPASPTEEATANAPDIAEVSGPLIPDGPQQPALPDRDTALAPAGALAAPPPPLLPPPAAPPVVADDMLQAQPNTDEASLPLVPGVADPALQLPMPAPLPPVPELADAAPDAMPVPDAPAPPEVATLDPVPDPALPGASAADMPGSKPAALPPAGAAPDTEVAILPTAETNPSSTLKPTVGLGQKTEGLIIGRNEATDPGLVPAAGDVIDKAAPPLIRFARAFENTEGKPLFAVVLIDTGEADLNRETLANLPFPVSFAIDPLDPMATERAAIYRAAGQEVIMLATGIAEGAQASDIEVAFQSMDQGLTEAVAVMDLPDNRFQGNRPLASLVVPVVAAQGRGLLTWDQGLNAADQVARREDVAAAVVFRTLDAAGEDRAGVRRLLDRAAFKAAQDGRVTVVGRTTSETVAALLEWAVEGKAATVALAPVSAVLTVD